MPVVAHLSDIHFGAHVDHLTESLLADVAARHPDLIVVSGDLTQRARRKEFAQAHIFLESLAAPVLAVVGNHDLPLLDLPRRGFAPTKRYQRYVNADLEPVVALPGVVVLGLDSMPAWRWKAGHVSQRQADVVERVLGGSSVPAWRLLVTHHPVLPAEKSGLVGRRRLVDACARAGVSVLLSGHTHLASTDLVTLGAEDDRRRALAVVAGTGISRRTRGTVNAYMLLDLSAPMDEQADLTVEIRQPDGPGWSAVRTSRFRHTDNGMVALESDET